jgi:bacteriorhodopsin
MYEYSFYITYIFLITTGTITFIEALRTKKQSVRNIFNLETCISIVAAYFYSIFIEKLSEPPQDITTLRYLDWSITTPMMLVTLLLTIQSQSNIKFIHLRNILYIFGLNYLMLLCGYLGETGIINKLYANLVGFVFFIGLFHYIYTKFNISSLVSKTILYAYISIWSLYGIVYFLPYDEKMLGYNILDLMAKCLMGIFLWFYFANIVRV